MSVLVYLFCLFLAFLPFVFGLIISIRKDNFKSLSRISLMIPFLYFLVYTVHFLDTSSPKKEILLSAEQDFLLGVDLFELYEDHTFYVLYGGHRYTGDYQRRGSLITLNISTDLFLPLRNELESKLVVKDSCLTSLTDGSVLFHVYPKN